MNKLIIALSVACASAYAFAAQKISTNDWFSASAESGSDVVTGGVWKDDKAPTINNNKYVIESELATPVTFTPTNSVAQNMATVNFKLDTAILPADARDPQLGTKIPDAKIAFAASEDSEGKAYYAWLGSEWTKLGGTPKDDGDSYDLEVAFKGAQVKFSVDGEDLGIGWYDYTSGAVPSAMAIDFVGSGNVASVAGNQQIVEAEIIVDGDVKIAIKEEDVEKFDLKGKTPAEFFVLDAKDNVAGFVAPNIKVATAYALGLIVDVEGTMTAVNGGYLTASAVAESADTKNITFAMNATARDSKDTGVIVSYQVVNETEGGDPTPGLTISKPGKVGLTKYKVQAILTNAAPVQ